MIANEPTCIGVELSSLEKNDASSADNLLTTIRAAFP
jgi:hypothetical protein